MQEVKIYCDMCKKELKGFEFDLNIVDIKGNQAPETFDICEECKDELVKLLETKRER